MAVVEKSSSVKLGYMCLSHEILDKALDDEEEEVITDSILHNVPEAVREAKEQGYIDGKEYEKTRIAELLGL